MSKAKLQFWQTLNNVFKNHIFKSHIFKLDFLKSQTLNVPSNLFLTLKQETKNKFNIYRFYSHIKSQK
jgi:hypothetical protein